MSKKLRSIALPIVASIVAPQIGIPAALAAAGASGANTLLSGGSPKDALFSAGGSYLGGQLAGNLLGDLGTVGGTVNSALGTSIGETAANALPNAATASLWGTPLNSVIGSQIGSNLASSLVPQKTANPVGESAAPGFKASREAEGSAPPNLSGMSPLQQSTNIATGGVYGGGAGPQETNYFLNMVNRRLVDDSGNVDTDFNDINPIENSYLQQLGYGGYDSPTNLLEALSKRKAA